MYYRWQVPVHTYTHTSAVTWTRYGVHGTSTNLDYWPGIYRVPGVPGTRYRYLVRHMAGCNFWGNEVDPAGLASISKNPDPTVYNILRLKTLVKITLTMSVLFCWFTQQFYNLLCHLIYQNKLHERSAISERIKRHKRTRFGSCMT